MCNMLLKIIAKGTQRKYTNIIMKQIYFDNYFKQLYFRHLKIIFLNLIAHYLSNTAVPELKMVLKNEIPLQNKII